MRSGRLLSLNAFVENCYDNCYDCLARALIEYAFDIELRAH
jgi:hypothetical protein